MRILLWILLLLCVFGAVSLYHARFTDAARDERALAHAAAVSGRSLPDGFGARVIVGEKSGASIVEGLRPVEAPSKANPAPTSSPQAKPTPPAAKPTQPAAPAAVTTHTVKRGESLSTIADKYYGTSKKDVVDALAKFNKLKSVNALAEGQELTIPPLQKLGVAAK
ncbi:MAG: LysM peptidoglycan-binding domain-containing protein [Planctomycetota bacterium]|nr:LysM peptidoglycan-binding domain-containing protein [Planctomycetota bacterium]